MIRNERGYALLLVIFMMLIFTILGTAILSASLGGATRTETRESDVQSLHLAEKSLNEATSFIISHFDGRDDISPDELSVYMGDLSNGNVRSDWGASTKLAGATAGVEITDVRPIGGTSSAPAYSYKVILTSEAIVNGVKRKLEQELLIGSFPDFLQYSFGSEERVVINGAVYAKGDVYAGHELKVYNKARYVYNGDQLKESTQFPHLDDKLYIQSNQSILYCDSVFEGCTGNENEYKSVPSDDPALLQRLLGVSYDQLSGDKNSTNFVSINIEESFIDKAAEAAGRSVRSTERQELRDAFRQGTTAFMNKLKLLGIDEVAPVAQPSFPTNWDDPVQVASYEAERDIYERYIDVFSSPQTKSLIHRGSLSLNGVDFKGLHYTESAKANNSWFIVDGDLTIENYSSEDLEVIANILVTGSVTISGDGIRVDSTIFCLGENSAQQQTIVQDARIKGALVNGSSKQLVLISRPDILLNRFQAFTNYGEYKEPNISQYQLDAFFYTEGEAELYGVGSTFWLNGGFFAKKKLTINAVLGSVHEKVDHTGILFDEQKNRMTGTKIDSRFVIDYNVDIFEDQYNGLPRVNQLSVQIGKRQLQR